MDSQMNSFKNHFVLQRATEYQLSVFISTELIAISQNYYLLNIH